MQKFPQALVGEQTGDLLEGWTQSSMSWELRTRGLCRSHQNPAVRMIMVPPNSRQIQLITADTSVGTREASGTLQKTVNFLEKHGDCKSFSNSHREWKLPYTHKPSWAGGRTGKLLEGGENPDWEFNSELKN